MGLGQGTASGSTTAKYTAAASGPVGGRCGRAKVWGCAEMRQRESFWLYHSHICRWPAPLPIPPRSLSPDPSPASAHIPPLNLPLPLCSPLAPCPSFCPSPRPSFTPSRSPLPFPFLSDHLLLPSPPSALSLNPSLLPYLPPLLFLAHPLSPPLPFLFPNFPLPPRPPPFPVSRPLSRLCSHVAP